MCKHLHNAFMQNVTHLYITQEFQVFVKKVRTCAGLSTKTDEQDMFTKYCAFLQERTHLYEAFIQSIAHSYRVYDCSVSPADKRCVHSITQLYRARHIYITHLSLIIVY